MTPIETITAELDRIAVELATIARWREMTVSARERKQCDDAARYWYAQERRWTRLAERERG